MSLSNPTVTIQIGNSEDRLTQKEWSSFVRHTDHLIRADCKEIFFAGPSPSDAPWQNYCWVVEPYDPDALREDLTAIRMEFKQHSAAWTEGETRFI